MRERINKTINEAIENLSSLDYKEREKSVLKIGMLYKKIDNAIPLLLKCLNDRHCDVSVSASKELAKIYRNLYRN